MPSCNTFRDHVRLSLPTGFILPGAILSTLDWLEDNGCVHRTTGRRRRPSATLYPGQRSGPGLSCVSIHAVDWGHAYYWLGEDRTNAQRLAPFVRTGGDGSHAALWLDTNDRQHFVHMGSGSGSTWAGIITDDPVDLLRFLAIGYREPCWPDVFELTASEAFVSERLDDGESLHSPHAFQQWLSTTFDVTIPSRACDIIRPVATDDDDETTDPFLRWLNAIQQSQ